MSAATESRRSIPLQKSLFFTVFRLITCWELLISGKYCESWYICASFFYCLGYAVITGMLGGCLLPPGVGTTYQTGRGGSRICEREGGRIAIGNGGFFQKGGGMAARLTDKQRKKIIADYVDLGSYNAVAKKHKVSVDVNALITVSFFNAKKHTAPFSKKGHSMPISTYILL
jgi:hypothetical protein